ncbi:MAG: HAD family hydrolase [Kineosporiaceae bacterium]
MDYGGVISEHRTPEAVAVLASAGARVAGDDPALVTARYWEHRREYDRGTLDDARYWSEVAGGPVSSDDPRLAELVDLDVRGWARTRERSVATVLELAGQGRPLALLSNTPVPHGEWMLAQPWAGAFATHVFSCRRGVVKPEAAIFEHTLVALGCRPDEAVLVDDRAENVAGARAVGIGAVHFEGKHSWDEVRSLLVPSG